MKSYLAPLILAFSLFQSAVANENADENEEFLGLLDPLKAANPPPILSFKM